MSTIHERTRELEHEKTRYQGKEDNPSTKTYKNYFIFALLSSSSRSTTR